MARSLGPKVIKCGCYLRGHLREERGGALTRLKTKLQVVFGDDENGHGFDKKEESKSNAERTLAAFLQLEVVGR